jgi:glutaredoxin-like YruB-family protein
MKKVTIYSTPTCHFCHLAKDYFKANNVPYEEFDVSTNIEKRTYMMEKSGQRGVPVITIDEDLVVGFNQPVIAKLLDIK